MPTRSCDVIGCPEAAAWVCAVPESNAQEDLLCNACWLQLNARYPEQAACYMGCNTALTIAPTAVSFRCAKPELGSHKRKGCASDLPFFLGRDDPGLHGGAV